LYGGEGGEVEGVGVEEEGDGMGLEEVM